VVGVIVANVVVTNRVANVIIKIDFFMVLCYSVCVFLKAKVRIYYIMAKSSGDGTQNKILTISYI
jgi:DsbC/DsbD-like thiol-disulfide interchange protein